MTQEELDELLKKEFPITMLSDEHLEKAKEIANGPHKLEAVKYIYSIIPDEGLKGAKIYFDLYLDDKNNL